MRISTALLSTLVAGGSMSVALQYSSDQQQQFVSLELPTPQEINVKPEDSLGTSAVSVEGGAPSPTTTEVAEAPSQSQGSPAADESPKPPTSSDATAAQESSPSDSKPSTDTVDNPPTEPLPEAVVSEAPPPPAESTVTSDVIDYKFGVVQIQLTAVGPDITNVVLLQGDTSYGRDVAYAALADATVKTDGINYGNVSGATFTTEAFKKAVLNAIAKL